MHGWRQKEKKKIKVQMVTSDIDTESWCGVRGIVREKETKEEIEKLII